MIFSFQINFLVNSSSKSAALKRVRVGEHREGRDIISILQSPMSNVMSGLQASNGQLIGGLLKTLEEKAK